MMILQAVLMKRKTEDGLMAFHENVELGCTYWVDLDTIVRNAQLQHIYPDGHAERHTKDLIADVEGAWLPLECLRLITD